MSFLKDKSIDVSKYIGDKINDAQINLREAQNFRGSELIKSLDRKLGRVHDMNMQHEALLKNLDEKLADYQKKSPQELVYYSVTKIDSNRLKNVEEEGI